MLFPTGSLGHGLPLASGLALAAREQHSDRRVYCLCSDGEWQEGSNWESLIFMVKHKLKVTLLIDQNGWQGFGRTFDLDAAPDLAPKLSVFGLDVSRCPGHDLAVLEEMLSPRPQGPRAVVLDTVKGRGLPFFEDRLESHYLPMTKEQYQQVNSAGSAEAERRP